MAHVKRIIFARIIRPTDALQLCRRQFSWSMVKTATPKRRLSKTATSQNGDKPKRRLVHGEIIKTTAVQSARRQALTLRRPNTTIPIHGMTMRFYRSSRGTDNFDETTTALVSTMSRAATTHRNNDDDEVTLGGYSYVTEERHRSATLAGDLCVTKEQQSPSSLVGDLYIAAEQRGAATSTSTTSTLVVDHCRRKAARTCCICGHERRGGHRTV